MNRIYIVTIVLLILALIVAIQNTVVISLKFLFWNFSGSQALIIVIIFFTGFLSGLALNGFKLWKRNREIKSLKSKLPPTPPTQSTQSTQ